MGSHQGPAGAAERRATSTRKVALKSELAMQVMVGGPAAIGLNRCPFLCLQIFKSGLPGVILNSLCPYFLCALFGLP